LRHGQSRGRAAQILNESPAANSSVITRRAVPMAGLSWEIGAYLALLASVAAAAPMALPAVHAWQARR